MSDAELPRGVALAWGVAANPQRGPKRELSIERIVEAAVELADAGGLPAVSMAAVASSLGFTPMSLYRYVAAKDDLLLLMEEAGLGLPPEAAHEAPDWRAALRVWLDGVTGTYLRHPWLLDLPVSGTPLTPNNLAWLDSALEALASTPLSEAEQLAVTLMLLAQARWEGHLVRGQQSAERLEQSDATELDRRRERVLQDLVTPEQFPWLSPVLASGAFGDDRYDPHVFAVDRIMDGLAAYVAAREAGEPAAAADPAPDDPAARDPRVREAAKQRREAEKHLREARKREREALAKARER